MSSSYCIPLKLWWLTITTRTTNYPNLISFYCSEYVCIHFFFYLSHSGIPSICDSRDQDSRPFCAMPIHLPQIRVLFLKCWVVFLKNEFTDYLHQNWIWQKELVGEFRIELFFANFLPDFKRLWALRQSMCTLHLRNLSRNGKEDRMNR